MNVANWPEKMHFCSIKKQQKNLLYFHIYDMKLDLTILSDKEEGVNLIQLSIK